MDVRTNRPDGSATPDDEAYGHEGSFATGQETIEHHPERPNEQHDFAEGEEQHHESHQGSFAEGQETTDHHPERPENRGDFAAGEEEEHAHSA